MKVFEHGDWKLSIDTEKTREFYANYKKKESQENRNFAKHCENLTEEERTFFESLGIDPRWCEVMGSGIWGDGELSYEGVYLVVGNYLKNPIEEMFAISQENEDGYIGFGPESMVQIGDFCFNFNVKKYTIADAFEDVPDGTIGIWFVCENVKWMLDEPCKVKPYKPIRFWEIHRMAAAKIRAFIQRKIALKETRETYEKRFSKWGIQYRAMSKKEIEKYKKNYLYTIAPEGTDMKYLKHICLKQRGCSVYLWHIFSYEILSCKEGREASKEYDAAHKQKCVFLDNCVDVGFELECANELSAERLEQFVDVTVTAKDFSWIYAKTHESDLGPYFYNEQKDK